MSQENEDFDELSVGMSITAIKWSNSLVTLGQFRGHKLAALVPSRSAMPLLFPVLRDQHQPVEAARGQRSGIDHCNSGATGNEIVGNWIPLGRRKNSAALEPVLLPGDGGERDMAAHLITGHTRNMKVTGWIVGVSAGPKLLQIGITVAIRIQSR